MPRDLDDNLRFRSELYAWLEDEGEVAEKLLADWCRRDVMFFADALVYMLDIKRHPGDPLRPWITLPFQEEIFRTVDTALGNPSVVDEDDEQAGHDQGMFKSRDMGASVCALICVDRRFLLYDYQVFVFVSANEKLVDNKADPNSMFPKLDIIHSQLPSFMLEGIHRNKAQFSIPSRYCIMDGCTTTGDASRSGRPHAIVVDEFAAWPINASFDFLAASAGATKCRLFISTPKGQGNGFHQIVKSGDIPFLRLHWTDHPWHKIGLYRSKGPGGALEFRDKEFWEEKRLSWLRKKYPLISKRIKGVEGDPLLRDVYPFFKDGKLRSPYYDHECIRAPFPWIVSQEHDLDFIGSGTPVYDHSRIDEIINTMAQVPFTEGDMDFDPFSFEPRGLVEREGGPMELWVNLVMRQGLLVPPPRSYTMGVDVSAGTGASNSGIVLWDNLSHEKIAAFTHCNLRPHALAEVAFALWIWFHKPRVIAEGQGHGKDFLSRLRELGCTKLFHMVNAKNERSDQPGLFTEGSAKNSLLMNLGSAVINGEAIIRDRQSLKEAKEFQLGSDGKMIHVASIMSKNPGGAKKNHGDRWMSDCLAWYLVKDWKNVDRNRIEEHIDTREPTDTERWMSEEENKHGRKHWGARVR